MRGRDLTAVGVALARFLGERWGGPVELVGLAETSAGARRGNILFDAVHPDGRRLGLVLTIPPPADTVIFGVEAEADALRLAEAVGAPVPHVHEVCPDPALFGAPFFVSSRLEGETVPRRVLRLVDAVEGLGPRLAAQAAAALARLHSAPAQDAPAAIRRPLDQAPCEAALEVLAGHLEELLAPAPTWQLARRWLEDHQPAPPAGHRLVHGDFRTGNLVVSADGLVGVLDWEGAHTGDPHEDLAWLCVRTWRFGNDGLEAGGFSALGPLVEAYRAAGGVFDPAAFHWWKVFGTLRWGVGLSRQAAQHLAGTTRSIVMATSGRRAAELEYDLLRLLAPAYS
ncbi:MAG: phosphotransferase family protein [Acidimicrobiales bacterium]